MKNTIDNSGYPIVLEGGVNLANFVPTKGDGRGNPFHNSATGKFSWAPPGVSITSGAELVKGLNTNDRKLLFEKASTVRANQLAAKIVDGKLFMVLLRDGRRLHSFSVMPPQTPQEGVQANPLDQTALDPAQLKLMQDAIRDAARQLNLSKGEILNLLKERSKTSLSPIELDQFVQEVKNQRITDLIDYLDTNLHRSENHDLSKRVRIQTPRGYLRRTFSALLKEDVQEVMERLQARGWSENIIQEKIVSQVPKKVRSQLEQPAKAKKSREDEKARNRSEV